MLQKSFLLRKRDRNWFRDMCIVMKTVRVFVKKWTTYMLDWRPTCLIGCRHAWRPTCLIKHVQWVSDPAYLSSMRHIGLRSDMSVSDGSPIRHVELRLGMLVPNESLRSDISVFNGSPIKLFFSSISNTLNNNMSKNPI